MEHYISVTPLQRDQTDYAMAEPAAQGPAPSVSPVAGAWNWVDRLTDLR